MKYNIILFVSMIAVVILGFSMLSASDHPESALIGFWSEREWEFDKVDFEGTESKSLMSKNVKEFTDNIKAKYGSDLRIHRNETWIFNEDHTLTIIDGEDTILADWILKGRGHILRITYPDGDVELYDVKEVNGNELVLHYDIGIEVRGIAKLIFKRKSEEFATKIRP